MDGTHADALRQFQMISNASIPEEQQIDLLEENNWNVELALLSYNDQYPDEAARNLRNEVRSTEIRRNASSGSQLLNGTNSNSASGNMSGERDANGSGQNGANNGTITSEAPSLFGAGGMFSRLIGGNRTGASSLGDPDIPGGFPYTHDGSSSPSSSSGAFTRGEPSKLHQMVKRGARFLLNSAIYAIVVPFYVIYKLLGLLLLVLLGYLTPLFRRLYRGRNYTLIRSRFKDPSDVARSFVEGFDVLVCTIMGVSHLNSPDESSTNSQSEQLPKTRDENLIEQPGNIGVAKPDFLECAYSDALYLVKKEARWLIVYIHSTQHEDTKAFIRDVLIDERFISFVRQRKILCWGGDAFESEAYQVANQFKVNKLPFLGLLCLTVNETPTASGTRTSAPILSLVCKIQGYTPLEEVLSRMNKAYNKFNPKVTILRAEYERQSQARLMKELQDQAYEKSLKRDRERRIARENKQKAEILKKQWIRWRRSVLKSEITESGQYARIAIRLPDGTRIQHRFGKQYPLEEIYAFVECNYISKQDTSGSSEAACAKPQDYNFKYPFKIVTIMPRREIPADETASIESYDTIYPSGNLVVEK